MSRLLATAIVVSVTTTCNMKDYYYAPALSLPPDSLHQDLSNVSAFLRGRVNHSGQAVDTPFPTKVPEAVSAHCQSPPGLSFPFAPLTIHKKGAREASPLPPRKNLPWFNVDVSIGPPTRRTASLLRWCCPILRPPSQARREKSLCLT